MLTELLSPACFWFLSVTLLFTWQVYAFNFLNHQPLAVSALTTYSAISPTVFSGTHQSQLSSSFYTVLSNPLLPPSLPSGLSELKVSLLSLCYKSLSFLCHFSCMLCPRPSVWLPRYFPWEELPDSLSTHHKGYTVFLSIWKAEFMRVMHVPPHLAVTTPAS